MSLEQSLDTLLLRWGTNATLLNTAGETISFPLLLQPVQQESKQYLENLAGPFGWMERGKALGWASARMDTQLQEGILLKVAGEHWSIRRREVISLATAPLYIWMVLQRGEGDE